MFSVGREISGAEMLIGGGKAEWYERKWTCSFADAAESACSLSRHYSKEVWGKNPRKQEFTGETCPNTGVSFARDILRLPDIGEDLN